MTTDNGQQAVDGISRRSLLRGGLLAGTGVATLGVASTVFMGTANASGWQEDWAYCNLCTVLWYAAAANDGACPANTGTAGNGGLPGHSVNPGTYQYEVNWGLGGNTYSDPQPNWRWCYRCQGLFWGGFGGVCWGNQGPSTTGPHNQGSTSYDVFWNSSGLQTQTNWRWCTDCSLIFWIGSGTGGGVCPATGLHHRGGSTNYQMTWYNYWD